MDHHTAPKLGTFQSVSVRQTKKAICNILSTVH